VRATAILKNLRAPPPFPLFSLALELKSENLSDYELLRARNIERNMDVMKGLGLDPKMKNVPRRPKAKQTSAKKGLPPPEPERRSKRVRGTAPEFTAEKINRFGDAIDGLIEAKLEA